MRIHGDHQEALQVGIDNDQLPSLKVFAEVIEEWKEDAIGDVFQVKSGLLSLQSFLGRHLGTQQGRPTAKLTKFILDVSLDGLHSN